MKVDHFCYNIKQHMRLLVYPLCHAHIGSEGRKEKNENNPSKTYVKRAFHWLWKTKWMHPFCSPNRNYQNESTYNLQRSKQWSEPVGICCVSCRSLLTVKASWSNCRLEEADVLRVQETTWMHVRITAVDAISPMIILSFDYGLYLYIRDARCI